VPKSKEEGREEENRKKEPSKWEEMGLKTWNGGKEGERCFTSSKRKLEQGSRKGKGGREEGETEFERSVGDQKIVKSKAKAVSDPQPRGRCASTLGGIHKDPVTTVSLTRKRPGKGTGDNFHPQSRRKKTREEGLTGKSLLPGEGGKKE